MFKGLKNLIRSNHRAFDTSNSEAGFTLIELLAVMAIVGSLSAIAISQYAEYKKDAYNITALSDFRNSMTGIEAYFDDNQAYPTCTGSDCEDLIPGLGLSQDVFLSYTPVNDEDVVGVACHTKGNVRYTFPSTAGLVIPLQGSSIPCGG